jgi:hypothetical protein
VPCLRVVGRIQRPFGVTSIALTGVFILTIFCAVYFMRSILLPIESEVARYLFTITAIKACLGLAVETAVGLLSPRNPVHNTDGEMRPVASGVRPFGEVSRAGTYFIWSPGSCR